MRRLTRLALLLSLAAAVALPGAALAAPQDHAENAQAPAITPRDLLARLWQPVARLFADSGATAGPHSDLDGVVAAADTHPGAAPPPAGSTHSAPPEGNEADGGPGSDPNG